MSERPFEGAWQWLPEGADGRLLLTHRHVCAVFGQGQASSGGGAGRGRGRAVVPVDVIPVCGIAEFD